MFKENADFYPTPPSLINKMLNGIDFSEIKTVLEPSAGSGNIVEKVNEKMKQAHHNYYSREEKKYDIDTIEVDQNLRYILQGKGYKVIHDDFLTYDGFKKYDLIVMNPPFSNGDKHVLKALELIEQGGRLVAIINAETIKNPYSNTRKDLINKLNTYNASIEYLQEEFREAERTTKVEIALIKITIENKNKNSIILDNLKQEELYRQSENQYNSNSLIDSDFIKGIVQQYQFEVKAGLKLINEYRNLQPLILGSFKKDNYSNCILNLYVGNPQYDKSDDILENAYIKKVRYKYWETLFNNEQFTSLLTSNLARDYRSKVTELQDYDFSYYNIKEIQLQMNKNIVRGVEDTILSLFDELSHEHSWYAETSNNIHYYNGWATNSAYKINKKVILILSAYSSWSGSYDLCYNVKDKLRDIEKVFNYLDGGLTEDNMDLFDRLKQASENHITKNIDLKYFTATFYKKGTCHLVFKDEELLRKFNIFGSQKKGFLPPSYGKKKYKDMTKQEQEVIKDFEGEASYNKVCNNLDYYLYNPNKILMIGA